MFKNLHLNRSTSMWKKLPASVDKLSAPWHKAWTIHYWGRKYNYTASCHAWQQVIHTLLLMLIFLYSWEAMSTWVNMLLLQTLMHSLAISRLWNSLPPHLSKEIKQLNMVSGFVVVNNSHSHCSQYIKTIGWKIGM